MLHAWYENNYAKQKSLSDLEHGNFWEENSKEWVKVLLKTIQ